MFTKICLLLGISIGTILYPAEGGEQAQEEFVEMRLRDDRGKTLNSFVVSYDLIKDASIVTQIEDVSGADGEEKVINLDLGSSDAIQPHSFELVSKIFNYLNEGKQFDDAVAKVVRPLLKEHLTEVIFLWKLLNFMGVNLADLVFHELLSQVSSLWDAPSPIDPFVHFVEQAQEDATLAVKLRAYFIEQSPVEGTYVVPVHTTPFPAPIDQAVCTAQSPWYLATAFKKEKSLVVAEISSFHRVKTLPISERHAVKCALSSDAKYLAYTDAAHIRLYDIAAGREAEAISFSTLSVVNPATIQRIIFSPGSTYIALLCIDRVIIWNAEHRKIQKSFIGGMYKDIQFLDDNILLLLAYDGLMASHMSAGPGMDPLRVNSAWGTPVIEGFTCFPNGIQILVETRDGFQVASFAPFQKDFEHGNIQNYYREEVTIKKEGQLFAVKNMQISLDAQWLVYSIGKTWRLLDLATKNFSNFISERDEILNLSYNPSKSQICVVTSQELLFYDYYSATSLQAELQKIDTLAELALASYIYFRKFVKKDTVVKIPQAYRLLVAELPALFQKMIMVSEEVPTPVRSTPIKIPQKEAPLPTTKIPVPAEPGLPELLYDLRTQLHTLQEQL